MLALHHVLFAVVRGLLRPARAHRCDLRLEQGAGTHALEAVDDNAVAGLQSRRHDTQPVDRAAGDSATLHRLQAQAAPDGPASDQLRLELRREIFRWAANQIRREFADSTWQAFWLTAVEEQSIAAASKELKLSAGAIYAARSRVMKRLKEKVNEFDEVENEGNDE